MMIQWQKRAFVFLTTLSALLLAAAGALAQDTQSSGTIRGGVYQDVNGDGRCLDTGIAGEDPVPGVEVVFVSSDRATVVTLTTGDNGTYGLAAAGQSIWEVTARPDPSRWIVTSENPLYVPVLPEEGMVQTDVNFCISQGANAIIVLPQSGAAVAATATAAHGGQFWAAITAVLGLALFGAGAVLQQRRQA